MRAIFLDRDGVINKFPGYGKYVTSIKGFKFLPNVKKAIADLKKSGFKIFIISNQACVGKGLLDKADLDLITSKMIEEIRSYGGDIDRVYYCFHLPEEDCSCRKPKIGSLKKAAKEFNINLSKSYFIGDSMKDILAARSSGCTSILVLTGQENLINSENWQVKPDFVFKNLYEASRFILRN
ncbi:MAG: HAD family hydrolase [Candidatus Omnitrophota bacterium]|jgi:histidinol-phosphate phosphatase family protein|nr:MAG: HAD family hydrolase [Candidatus Omnitrophota bacterium]